jgi:SAM-dependent methyltransferase
MVSSPSGKIGIFKRKFKSLIYYILFYKERMADFIRGVDLTSPVSREEAGTENVEGALYYASSGFMPELTRALNFMDIQKSDSILDYGSGKGGALVRLSRYPFRRVVGIELSSKLADISKTNIRKLGIENVEVICGDATTYSDIDDFNYFYFFNPFAGNIFETVIQNVIASAKRAPRPVTVIYCNPRCHDLIMETGAFLQTRQFIYGARALNIYQLILKRS